MTEGLYRPARVVLSEGVSPSNRSPRYVLAFAITTEAFGLPEFVWGFVLTCVSASSDKIASHTTRVCPPFFAVQVTSPVTACNLHQIAVARNPKNKRSTKKKSALSLNHEYSNRSQRQFEPPANFMVRTGSTTCSVTQFLTANLHTGGLPKYK